MLWKRDVADCKSPHIHALDNIIKMMAGLSGGASRGAMSVPITAWMRSILVALRPFTTRSAMMTANPPMICQRADVVIVGVSRTSKTPTCVYLANKGIKGGQCAVCA